MNLADKLLTAATDARRVEAGNYQALIAAQERSMALAGDLAKVTADQILAGVSVRPVYTGTQSRNLVMALGLAVAAFYFLDD